MFLALLVLVAVLVLLALFCLRLLLQYGRLLNRVEELERAAPPDAQAGGLPPGSVVSNFELPALDGSRMALERWRGRRMLLIFFDPACEYCRTMLPALASLDPEPADGRPVPVIASSGGIELNRTMFEQAGVRCVVLLQEEHELARLYQVTGAPTGYLIDEQGLTAGGRAEGAEALLALAGADPSAAARGEREAASSAICPLPERQVNRNGLAAGSPAPAFRLPSLDGRELALESYRGRRVLLVFSDPACEPCEALAPRLAALHRGTPGVEILMVSRGDAEANRRMATAHDLGFPIILQRHWDVSRAYGMLATPIAYLVDERGTIAAPVAVGADAILTLASNARGSSTGSPARIGA